MRFSFERHAKPAKNLAGLESSVRLLAIGALALSVLALAGCGSSSSTSTSAQTVTTVTAGTGVNNSEVKFLADYMADRYFWYDRIPAVDLSKYATPEAALPALKVPEDRYSFIEPAATFNSFFDEGKTVGLGVGLTQLGTTALVVRLVQPDSNAAAAGLQRGDHIVAINDVPVATLIAENRLDAAIGPSDVGITLRFKLARDATGPVVSVTKSLYSIRYVLAPQVIDNGGRKTGYLYFFSFGNIGLTAWNTELQKLLDLGIQDLVVDLRDNGGGLLNVGNEMASALVTAGNAGQIATRLEHNKKHSDLDQSFTFKNNALAGRIDRLAWITSPRTCSASEALITALQPFKTMARVGETTCGKPVGFEPPQYNGKAYAIVTFRSLNNAGFSDYFSGLPATCPAGDDFTKPLGDSAEPRLSAALAVLRNEACPPTTKSLPGQLRSAESILESGFARVSGVR